MPETYKSFGTILGTTGATTIYSGVCSGVAIVNSAYFANTSTSGGSAITLEVVKGSTAYDIVFNAPIPLNTTLQALDSPIVLEANNSLRVFAANSNYLNAFVTVLEVT